MTVIKKEHTTINDAAIQGEIEQIYDLYRTSFLNVKYYGCKLHRTSTWEMWLQIGIVALISVWLAAANAAEKIRVQGSLRSIDGKAIVNATISLYDGEKIVLAAQPILNGRIDVAIEYLPTVNVRI